MKKHALALGLLIILGASSCAPVASSVPKLATVSTHGGDSIVDDHGGIDLKVISSVEVVSSDQSDAKVKNLKADGFTVNPALDQHDREFSDFRDAHGLHEIKLPADLNRVEVVTVIVLKAGTKAIPESLESDLGIKWSRTKKNELSFDVDQSGKSITAWAFVKENIDSIVIASREAKIIKN
jgi:hypothetical protein